jgi:hypothetical protein
MQILTLAVTPKVNQKKLVAQQSLQRYFGSFLLGDPTVQGLYYLPEILEGINAQPYPSPWVIYFHVVSSFSFGV